MSRETLKAYYSQHSAEPKLVRGPRAMNHDPPKLLTTPQLYQT